MFLKLVTKITNLTSNVFASVLQLFRMFEFSFSLCSFCDNKSFCFLSGKKIKH